MYQNFNYISSEVIVAEVKQRLHSYFDSGALKETLIPTYISNALRKLKVLAMEYKEEFITIENYKGKLPKEAHVVKDAYLCQTALRAYQDVVTNRYEYYKKIYCNDSCGNEYETFSQLTQTLPNWIEQSFKPQLLKIYYTSSAFCAKECKGINLTKGDVIKISKNTITTEFESGEVYLQYYTVPEDEYGPLIPEIIEVEEYLKNTLYLNFYEDLFNNLSDESSRVMEEKVRYYSTRRLLTYESALGIIKSETPQQYRDNLHKQRTRLIKFLIG